MQNVRESLDKLTQRVADEIERRNDVIAYKGGNWMKTKGGDSYVQRTEYLEVICRNLEAVIDQLDNYAKM